MKSAEELLALHRGLAVYCARRFQGRGVPMEELICEAQSALWLACLRFDQGRGLRFSTYAVPVVLGALRQLCRQAAPPPLPGEDWGMAHQPGFEDWVLLGDALSRLPPPLPLLCSLRFQRGLTQLQTARLLGVSQSCVSRLEKRLRQELR